MGIKKLADAAIKLEKAFKEAKAREAFAEKFPIEMKRAKPLTKQEITEHADRVARQQSGEFVRKSELTGNPKDTQNLAGRSKKEVDRLKKLKYTLEPTRELRPTPTYEGKVGDVNIALPGDQTISDLRLLDVEGLPIESTQQGGSLYGEGKLHLEDPLFWASGQDIAQQFQDKVTALSHLYNTDDIMAYHLAMGMDSNNYAMHFADANLRAIANSNPSKKAIKIFNAEVRKGFKDQKGNLVPLDHFVGIENPEEAYLQMMEDPALRKWFNNRMKIDKVTTDIGLPSGKDIQWAITEPALRDMEINLTGHSVGKMVPEAELTNTAEHATYEAGIPGISMGKAPELAPFELAFPDATDYVRATQRPQDFTGTIQKVFPHQIMDQQQLDQMSEYYRRLREIRGFKEGGSASLEDEFRRADIITSDPQYGSVSYYNNPVDPPRFAGGGISQKDLVSAGKSAYKQLNVPNPKSPFDIAVTQRQPVKGAKQAIINLGEEFKKLQDPQNAFNAMLGTIAPVEGAAKATVNFVSSVEKAIKGHKMESMGGQQWVNWIKANASKSAKKEAESTGLYDWLQSQGKVNKKDIEQYVELNLPKFQKTEYGFGNKKLTPEQEERLAILEQENAKMPLGAIDDIYGEGTYDELIQLQNIRDKATTEKLYQLQPELERKANIAQQRGDKELAKKYWDEINHITARAEHLELKDTASKPRFEKFKEPGGENYREVTLSLPKPMKEYNQFIDKIREKYGEGALDSLPLTAAERRTLDNLYAKEERGVYKVPGAHSYGDDISDINRLLHYRANDRLTPEGKKVSFLEELQADWAQQGRKYGFGEGVTIKQDANGMYRAYDINGNLIELRAEGGPYVAMNTEDDVRKALANSYYSKGLPEGPYVTDTGDWTKLGLKHALKDAVEQGHDYLAWTTGEQQAKRYDLSKEISEIHYSGTDLKAYDHNGNTVISETGVRHEDLPNIIGKDVADKLLAQPQQGTLRSLVGQDIKVGGEGMKGYYDQIVPQSVRDILKEYGIKNDVMPIEIQMERAIDESGMPSMYPSKSTNMAIEITPELRDKIFNEGLSYFKRGGEVNLEEEFRKADMFADGGWSSKYTKKPKMPEYDLLPSAKTVKQVGKILGKKAQEEYGEETAKPTLRAIPDVALNIGADIVGAPADIANIVTKRIPIQSKARPFGIYEQLKQSSQEGEPMFGSENIRKNLRETGIVERERPLIETAIETVLPFGNKLKGLPVGMSIEDVTPKTVNFVSSVEKAIKGHKMESMNGEQWANWMRANASKSAKKEAEATGLYDWLKSQGKVSKADIEAYVEGNLPQIEPVVKSGPKATYATYTEPGGRNYREIVYALKKKPSEVPMPEGFKVTEVTYPETGETGFYAETPSTRSAFFKTREEAEIQLQRYAENVAKAGDESKTYRSGHYRDIDNPLVHMRVKDRETPEGRRVHFLEELQSDWAQKARKKGIKQNVTDDVVREYYETHGKRGDNSLPWEELPSKDKAFLRHIIENRQVDAVPPAPYITDTADWTKLGLKKALKDAIESGQDYLAWTTGQQQADRYSLSKYLENVRAAKTPEGTYSFYAYEKGADRGNLPTIAQHDLTENELADHLGKEMAQKIVNDLAEAKPTQVANYDNIDLQLGGEGMKGYYDKIMPQAMNDILKQYGITDGVKPVKVQYANKIYYDDRVEDLDDLLERGQLTPHQRQILEVFRDDIDSAKARGEDPWRLESNVAKWIAEQNRAPDTITEHMGIEITPELREKILNEGLPHFKAGGSVDVVPFPRDN